MDPALEGYIIQCRAAGMTNADILSALKAAGWTDEQLTPFVTSLGTGSVATPPVVATPPTQVMNDLDLPQDQDAPIEQSKPSRAKKIIVGVALTLIVLLLPLSAIIVAAENGYLPAVSRLYRKTSLPLLWNGTNGNGPLSMGRVLAASTDHQTQEGEIVLGLKMTSTTGEAKTVQVPFTRQFRFAAIENTTALCDPESTFCIPDESESEEDIVVPTFNYLPLDISIATAMKLDGAGAYDVAMTLDTKKLVVANPAYADMLPATVQEKLTFDFRAVAAAKKMFLRSNVFPYQPGDGGKWIANPLDSAIAADLIDPANTQNELSDAHKKELSELAEKIVTDHGIERRDGNPYAHYEVMLDKDAMATLKESNLFKEAFADVSVSDDSLASPLTINLWVAPRTAKLAFMTATTTWVDVGVRTVLDFNYKMAYGTQVEILAPGSDEVLNEDLNDTLNSIFSGS